MRCGWRAGMCATARRGEPDRGCEGPGREAAMPARRLLHRWLVASPRARSASVARSAGYLLPGDVERDVRLPQVDGVRSPGSDVDERDADQGVVPSRVLEREVGDDEVLP